MMIMQWGYDPTFVYIAATGLQSTGEGCIIIVSLALIS